MYLGRRDFVDHITHVDPIDGVVLVDPEYLKDRKVYGHVLAAFRYGREDLDVLGKYRNQIYIKGGCEVDMFKLLCKTIYYNDLSSC